MEKNKTIQAYGSTVEPLNTVLIQYTRVANSLKYVGPVTHFDTTCSGIKYVVKNNKRWTKCKYFRIIVR